MHSPELQWSSTVQSFPSSHATPSATFVWTGPVAGLQVSMVHDLPSSGLTAVPWQVPAAVHLSPVVQALPSLQVIPV
jgi:hypothetical protein